MTETFKHGTVESSMVRSRFKHGSTGVFGGSVENQARYSGSCLKIKHGSETLLESSHALRRKGFRQVIQARSQGSTFKESGSGRVIYSNGKGKESFRKACLNVGDST